MPLAGCMRSRREANKSFPVVQNITKLLLNGADIYILCYMIWRTVTGREFTDIGQTLDGILTSTHAGHAMCSRCREHAYAHPAHQ